MDETNTLATVFEQHRTHLKAVAYRMLGSLAEAEDAVQEAWLRLGRSDTAAVQNLGGWLTTVVARICLDTLRSRKARPEEPFGADGAAEGGPVGSAASPEHEAELAESVGLALLVVLEMLDPAERLAFVLHDMFAVPFDEIASIVGRSADATRQLASRARRRVQGAPAVPEAELGRQREIVAAFLGALQKGDIAGLVAVLDPDVVVRMSAPGGTREVRGALTWATGAVTASRLARGVEVALVNGSVGLVLASKGRLRRALTFTIEAGKITSFEVVADPARLEQFEIAVLGH